MSSEGEGSNGVVEGSGGPRVVLAGGGTAGHISPMVATAEALQALRPEATITCVGTPKGMESRVVPDRA